MQRTQLDSGWSVRRAPGGGEVPARAAPAVDAGIPATVPGCIHDDLLAAGLIADPYLDGNEALQHWVGRQTWEYRGRLPGVDGDPERIDLVCHGLDTFAALELGGRPIGSTANMHRTYRFDITEPAKAGGDDLLIRFGSPWDAASRVAHPMGERANVFPGSAHHLVRKMACNFGWDWGPTVVTSGIWRPIEVQAWSTARLAEVRTHVSVTGGTGRVVLDIAAERTRAGGGAGLAATASVGSFSTTTLLPPGQDRVRMEVEVPDAQLWQLHTRGRQQRYDLQVRLTADGRLLDTARRRIGFRRVELVTGPDDAGSSFRFRINGTDEYIRGFNWIPDDPLITRVTADRYRERLTQAVRAGANLVRVWGGGIYESDAFYDICDELGLLVWQDFLFACAMYPEEEPLWSQVAAEARDNVVRLMHHPSLALWNGNNENLWGFYVWGWKDAIGTAPITWGKRYYLELLPSICAELDPGRAYWPGSPWSGSDDLFPNDPDHGCNHSWQVWNYRDDTAYYEDVPRFVAEFGWQAPPTWHALTGAVHDDPLTPTSPGLMQHQKADHGDRKLREGMRPRFGDVADTGDPQLWHYLTQVNQVRAVTTGLAHWRSHWPHNAGAVVWQLNDCWPAISWAALDMDLTGTARPKPLYFALQHLFAPRLLTIQERRHRRGAPRDAAGLLAVAVNNAGDAWTGDLQVSRLGFTGAVLARWSTPMVLAPGAAVEVALPGEVGAAGDPASEVLVARLGELRDLHFYEPDHRLRYPDPGLTVTAAHSDAGTAVTVASRGLARDLLLQADRFDGAAATRGLITLLPGESTTITVPGRRIPDSALVPPALQHIGAALGRC